MPTLTLRAFRRLLDEYPEIGTESICSIKRASGMTVITLAAPPGIDKEGAGHVFHTEYQRQLEALDAPCGVTEATQRSSPFTRAASQTAAYGCLSAIRTKTRLSRMS